MSKKNRDQDWAKAKKLCRLAAEDVQMAKELGLNPRKLPKHNPSPSQQWKLPVKLWIRELYEKMKHKQASKRERKGPAPGPMVGTEAARSIKPACAQGPPRSVDEVPF